MVSLEMLLSLTALIIAIISLVHTIISSRRQEFTAGRLNNLAAISDIERMIADNPQILELHGVSLQELEQSGITSNEIAYLLSSFTAGRLYYSSNDGGTVSPFEVGSYRYNMLSSHRTRKAWPIIKKLMEPGKYRDKIDITIKEIEQENKHAK
jgi:hypothetical protein